MHRTTERFWKCFVKLPKPIQKVARQNFEFLKSNHLHPSLHFKKIDKIWLVRIGLNYRALAIQDNDDYIWGLDWIP
jgi:hypothetical protein